MKIVQTFWSGNSLDSSLLKNTGGWLAPEYHWMAWALSAYQLRQFYEHLELVTDGAGEHILIDTLQLPYTHVRTDLQTALQAYPQALWALAKIYAYSLQDEAFLHIDGDVFIWKRFEKAIENAPLVAQNFEVDFPFYHAPLRTMQTDFEYIPDVMQKELQREISIFSCNTGVIGGTRLDVFQEYQKQAFKVIDENLQHLHRVEIQHFNICFEQFLYYCLSKEKQIDLAYVIDNQSQFDSTYPGFANFHKVPFDEWFIHCMADYKRQEVVVRHLAKRLRRDYGVAYYRLLRLCAEAGIVLHWQCYHLPELDPQRHNEPYFGRLEQQYRANALPKQANEWVYFYAKDRYLYHEVELIFGQTHAQLMAQVFAFDDDCRIEETDSEELKQTLHFPVAEMLKWELLHLDPLNMVLLDALQSPKSITQAAQEASLYFNPIEIAANPLQFDQLVIERFRAFWYAGAIKKLPLTN